MYYMIDIINLYIILCSVPQGSVLSLLFFILCITRLSSVISSLNLNYHLYADDTQLFYSLYPSDYDATITRLQNALELLLLLIIAILLIASWMTANLSTLNSSKTEFLLIGTNNNLLKYAILLLIPLTLLGILALSLMNISLSLIK